MYGGGQENVRRGIEIFVFCSNTSYSMQYKSSRFQSEMLCDMYGDGCWCCC